VKPVFFKGAVATRRTREKPRPTQLNPRPRLGVESTEIMDTPRIRVLIADDYYAFRQALKVMLTFEPDIEVVAEATSGRQTLEQAQRLKPSVIVTDLSMGALSGRELIRQLVSNDPSVNILIVSGQADQRVIEETMECGAKGYISKSRSLTDVPAAIRKICKGQTIVRRAQANRTADHSV
jgi:two-component system, NarL family, response regulator NreC